MGKEPTKKAAPAPSHAKKGRVIDRRRNRTVSQDVKTSPPKWERVGGVLVRTGQSAHGPHSNPIHLQGSKFSSVSYQPPPPAVEAEWVGIPLPEPTGKLPVVD